VVGRRERDSAVVEPAERAHVRCDNGRNGPSPPPCNYGFRVFVLRSKCMYNRANASPPETNKQTKNYKKRIGFVTPTIDEYTRIRNGRFSRMGRRPSTRVCTRRYTYRRRGEWSFLLVKIRPSIRFRPSNRTRIPPFPI